MISLNLDVDGPLADLRRHIVEVLGLNIDPYAVGPYEVADWIPEHAALAQELMNKPEFWLTLPITEGAQEGVELLRSRNVDITIVTAFFESCPMWFDARVEWLAKNFNFEPDRIIFAKRKYKVEADRFIDDSVDKIEDWEKKHPNGRAYLFTAPHNVTYTRLHRVDWSTIDRIF